MAPACLPQFLTTKAGWCTGESPSASRVTPSAVPSAAVPSVVAIDVHAGVEEGPPRVSTLGAFISNPVGNHPHVGSTMCGLHGRNDAELGELGDVLVPDELGRGSPRKAVPLQALRLGLVDDQGTPLDVHLPGPSIHAVLRLDLPPPDQEDHQSDADLKVLLVGLGRQRLELPLPHRPVRQAAPQVNTMPASLYS